MVEADPTVDREDEGAFPFAVGKDLDDSDLGKMDRKALIAHVRFLEHCLRLAAPRIDVSETSKGG